MSDKPDQMDQEARELINTLDDPVLAVEARSVQAMSAMDDLKNEVLGFFKNRMASITRAERIKELTYQQLEGDIESGSLNFEQKMALLMRLSRDNNDLSDSIISMFRPAGNGSGSLLTDIVRPGNDKTDLAQAFASYTPEELRKIDAVAKTIRDIVESGNVVEVPQAGKE